LQTFFAAIDEDGGGYIEFSEFLAFVSQSVGDHALQEKILAEVKRTVRLCMMRQHMTVEELERRFYNAADEGIFDIASFDGSLRPEEMRRFFRKILNVTKHDAPDRHLAIAFKAMDDDGGGTLDAEEFLAFIRGCLQGETRSALPGPNYPPPVLAGIRGVCPERMPQSRPGTIASKGDVSALPFCLSGRELPATSRFTCGVPAPLRPPARLRHTRSEPSLHANGLPHLIWAPVSSTSGTAKSSTWPSGSRSLPRNAPSDENDNVERDHYLNMKNADTLNRVENWLYKAGVDVRGQYHCTK